MKTLLQLIVTILALALGGCGPNRPLLGEELMPVGPSRGAAGQSGTTTQPGVEAPQCLTDKIPAEPQPLAPTHTVQEACALGANAPGSSLPAAGNDVRNDDRGAEIVGRWTVCGPDGVFGRPQAAIEFGRNGRWQLLALDPSGALVPASEPDRGYYYFLGTGQLVLTNDGPNPGGGAIFFPQFAAGKDALRFENNWAAQPRSAVYARIAASPSDGADNAPSVSKGGCSMVGSWDAPANTETPTAPASTWWFDASGRFVVTPRGGDVCATPPMYGTYQVADLFLQLKTSWNLGLCEWWSHAAYQATFDATCNVVQLDPFYDLCNGGRGYLNGSTTLTRRR